MKKFINDFIYGVNIWCVNRLTKNGMKTYVALDAMTRITSREQRIDVRPFHSMYDHTLIWERILSILCESNILFLSDETLNAQRQVKATALLLRNAVLKYNILTELKEYEKANIEKLQSMMERTRLTELSFLQQLEQEIK